MTKQVVVLGTATRITKSVRIRYVFTNEEYRPGYPFVRVYEQDMYGLKNWRVTVGRKFFTVDAATQFIKSKGYDVKVAYYEAEVK